MFSKGAGNPLKQSNDVLFKKFMCDPHLSGQDQSVIENAVRSAFGWFYK